MYVELNHIQKRYGNYQASDDVSFGIEKGKLIGLLGPSGSGKTTILRMIAGLEHPDSGEIRIDGIVVNDIPASKRGIGFVFQNYNLFANMTALKNVMEPLVTAHKVPKEEARQRALEALAGVGLADRADYYPAQLSGGQQQRVAIARAMAVKPDVILFDEPTSALDPELIGAARMLGCSERKIFTSIIIPSSVPYIFTGLQIAISSSWAAVVAAEMVRSTNGIGWMITAGQGIGDMQQIMVGILVIGVIGFLLSTLMRGVESRLCAWSRVQD